jgi:hypothetical protein
VVLLGHDEAKDRARLPTPSEMDAMSIGALNDGVREVVAENAMLAATGHSAGCAPFGGCEPQRGASSHRYTKV